MEPTPEEIEAIARICKARLRLSQDLIAAYHHLCPDDLLQEAMIRALRAHTRYRKPWSYSSFIGRAASAGIADAIKKVRGQGKTRNIPKSVDFNDLHGVSQESQGKNIAESVENLGWSGFQVFARGALMVARERFPRFSGHGPHRYTHGQLAAAAATRHKFGWSYRALVLFMPQIQEQLELRRLPHFSTVQVFNDNHRRGVRGVIATVDRGLKGW